MIVVSSIENIMVRLCVEFMLSSRLVGSICMMV